jgi:isopenicillin N synthase-like dioxygenase
MLPTVPVVDISGFRAGDADAARAAAAAIDVANREVGFFAIAGHGVPPSELAHTFEASASFFDRPLDGKLAYAPDPGARHHGYHRPAASGLAAKEGIEQPPDLREYFMVGRFDLAAPYFHTDAARTFHRPNRLPPELAAPMAAYYARAERLGADLMRLFALALGLDETWFADKIDRHFSILSSIHYPPLAAPPLPGQVRAGAHTDYGALTILAQAPGGNGLQVKLRSDEWIDVPCRPELFVVNIGDMMERWTAGRWVSNFHRVANPGPDEAARARRSLAYFLHPNHDAIVECVPGCAEWDGRPAPASIRAGDYMLDKEREIDGA